MSSDSPRISHWDRLRNRKVAALAAAALLSPLMFIAPAGALDISLANDVDITQVVLNDNGTIVTQNASGGPTQNGTTPVELVSVTIDDNGTPVVLDNFHTAVDITNIGFPPGHTGATAYQNATATDFGDPGFELSLIHI